MLVKFKCRYLVLLLFLLAVTAVSAPKPSDAYVVEFNGTVSNWAFWVGPGYETEDPFPFTVGDPISVSATVNDSNQLIGFSFTVDSLPGFYTEELNSTELSQFNTGVSTTLIYATKLTFDGNRNITGLDNWALNLSDKFFSRNYNIRDDNSDGVISGDEFRSTDAYNFNAVPIPGAVILLGSGIITLMTIRKREKK